MLTDYETSGLTQRNSDGMLDWLIRFAWPIIGAVALLLLLLWICHVVKNNAVTRFFTEDGNPELQSVSRNVAQRTTINMPVDSIDELTVLEAPRRTRRVRTATGLQPRRIREIVFLSLIVIADNGTMPAYPVWCSCPAINQNTAFLVQDICEPIIMENAGKSPMSCSCWNNNGWHCPDALLVVNFEAMKKCTFYKSGFTTEPTILYTTSIKTETDATEMDSMENVFFVLVAAIAVVITIVVIGKITMRSLQMKVFRN